MVASTETQAAKCRAVFACSHHPQNSKSMPHLPVLWMHFGNKLNFYMYYFNLLTQHFFLALRQISLTSTWLLPSRGPADTALRFYNEHVPNSSLALVNMVNSPPKKTTVPSPNFRAWASKSELHIKKKKKNLPLPKPSLRGFSCNEWVLKSNTAVHLHGLP